LLRLAVAAAALLGLAACTPPEPRRVAELPGWGEDALAEAIPAYLSGCGKRTPVQTAALCAEAAALPPGDHAARRVKVKMAHIEKNRIHGFLNNKNHCTVKILSF